MAAELSATFREAIDPIDPGDIVSVRVEDPEMGRININYRTRP